MSGRDLNLGPPGYSSNTLTARSRCFHDLKCLLYIFFARLYLSTLLSNRSGRLGATSFIQTRQRSWSGLRITDTGTTRRCPNTSRRESLESRAPLGGKNVSVGREQERRLLTNQNPRRLVSELKGVCSKSKKVQVLGGMFFVWSSQGSFMWVVSVVKSQSFCSLHFFDLLWEKYSRHFIQGFSRAWRPPFVLCFDFWWGPKMSFFVHRNQDF